jgi:glycosyltransferase involved in cell wall biosynthesis
MSNIELTAAIPVYNASNIFWLCLEGLCRQQTSHSWEIIVCEDPSVNFSGPEYIKEYKDRLTAAGCVDITYLKLKKWIPLGSKWVHIANHARGERFMLTASDDYSPPDRVEQTCKHLTDDFSWFDYRQGLFYDLFTGNSAKYTSLWPHTGCWMATKTDLVKKLKIPGPSRYVDGWMQQQFLLKPKQKKTLDIETNGFHTDGLNSISVDRRGYYCDKKSAKWRWEMPGRATMEQTRQNFKEIIPTDVWNKLQEYKTT